MKSFLIPANIIFGEGSLSNIKNIISNHNSKNILIICDKGIRQVGLVDKLENEIKGIDINYSIFDGVVENPTDVMINYCSELYQDKKIDMIIAIGGGSSIDSAKAINIVLSNGGKIEDYYESKAIENTVPLIAIPTTAGTGSEVTNVSVVTDTKNHKKIVIFGGKVKADYAVLDSSLTYTLPSSITAATGMDALTHAIEAYISKQASVFTDLNAKEAIRLIAGSIETAVMNGKDKVARENMMLGSVIAGFAFNSAILGLVHGVAHPLGAHFGIPHGVANATMLPYVIEYNGDSCIEKIKVIGEILGIAREKATPTNVCNKLLEINKKIGIKTLSELGIKKEDFSLIADETLEEPSLLTNPKDVDKDSVMSILNKAF